MQNTEQDNYKTSLLEYIVRDRQLRENRTESDYEQFCEEHCIAIEQTLKQLDLARREILIKNEYMKLIDAISFDYDGCETAEDLKRLIDNIRDYIKKAYNSDDTSSIYGVVGKKMNILMEEL